MACAHIDTVVLPASPEQTDYVIVERADGDASALRVADAQYFQRDADAVVLMLAADGQTRPVVVLTVDQAFEFDWEQVQVRHVWIIANYDPTRGEPAEQGTTRQAAMQGLVRAVGRRAQGFVVLDCCHAEALAATIARQPKCVNAKRPVVFAAAKGLTNSFHSRCCPNLTGRPRPPTAPTAGR